MPLQVGFIGVGIMGGAIARRLLDRGIGVVVYDPDEEAMQRIVAIGGSAACSPRAVADIVEIVFACVPDESVCRAIALGEGGVAAGGCVRFYVETSTIGGAAAARLARDLGEKGIGFVDCPIVGGHVALNDGTLGVLVSCPADTFEYCRFALEAFAGRLFYLGAEPGIAQAGKVMNNAVAYAALLATCEAVAVGMKAGITIEDAVAIINQGSGSNFFSQRIFPQFILNQRFDGTGPIEIGIKDVKLFLAEADRLAVSTPMASSVSKLQHEVLQSGPSGRDTTTAFHYFTDLAGLPRLA